MAVQEQRVKEKTQEGYELWPRQVMVTLRKQKKGISEERERERRTPAEAYAVSNIVKEKGYLIVQVRRKDEIDCSGKLEEGEVGFRSHRY